MKVYVFAALKDFMPSESELNTSINNIESLREVLILKYPAAREILNSCRFSTDKEILSQQQDITHYENIFVIPPSSGG